MAAGNCCRTFRRQSLSGFRCGGCRRLRCLVTGATGFIGGAVCRALLDAGHEVVCLVRSHGAAPASTAHIVEDLCTPLSPTLSLQGVDVVVHSAGIAHRQAPAVRHIAVNERATLALARRAVRDGVERFIFLSSVKAMGPAAGPKPRCETELAEPGGAYAVSKRRAEIALSRLAGDSRMQLVSLRPALVYGAGVGGNLASLMSWVKRGLPLIPEAGARSMVSRDDLVRLVVSLVNGAAGPLPKAGAVWNVTDGEAYSTQRLMLAMADAMGRPAPRLILPAACWRILGACVDLRNGAMSGATTAALLGHDLYDSTAVRAATGWRPQQRFEDVLPTMLDTATVA
ncbi:MAG: NAD-dependent epimerase/dehydratase family protein [Chromatocurvus sp.]